MYVYVYICIYMYIYTYIYIIPFYIVTRKYLNDKSFFPTSFIHSFIHPFIFIHSFMFLFFYLFIFLFIHLVVASVVSLLNNKKKRMMSRASVAKGVNPMAGSSGGHGGSGRSSII